jgi:hypothetical protein
MTLMSRFTMLSLISIAVLTSGYGYGKPLDDAKGMQNQSLSHLNDTMFSSNDAVLPKQGVDYPYKGYSSTRRELGQTVCYKSDYQIIGDITESGFKSQFFSSMKEASESFGFDLSAGVTTPKVSGSGSMGFSESSYNQDFTLSYYVGVSLIQEVDIDIKSESKEQLFTQQGQLVLSNNSNNGVASNVFTEKCGDLIYSKVKRGAAMIAKLDIVFSSRAHKDSFKASVSVGVPVAELSSKIESESSNASSDLRIVVSTLARGVNKRIVAGYDVGTSVCTPANLSGCLEIVKRIERFIGSDDPQNSFRASVGEDTYVPLSADFIPVSTLGLIQIEPLAENDKTAQDRFVRVKTNYVQHLAIYNWVKTFYNVGHNDSLKQTLADTVANIEAMISLIDQYGGVCFSVPSQCHEKWTAFKAEAAPIVDRINQLKPQYEVTRYMYRLPIYDIGLQAVKMGADQGVVATIPLYATEGGIVSPYFAQLKKKILNKYYINNVPGPISNVKDAYNIIVDSKFIFAKPEDGRLAVYPFAEFSSYEKNSIIAMGNDQTDKDEAIVYTPAGGIFSLHDANVNMKDALVNNRNYLLNVFNYRYEWIGFGWHYVKTQDHKQISLDPEPCDFYPGVRDFSL